MQMSRAAFQTICYNMHPKLFLRHHESLPTCRNGKSLPWIMTCAFQWLAAHNRSHSHKNYICFPWHSLCRRVQHVHQHLTPTLSTQLWTAPWHQHLISLDTLLAAAAAVAGMLSAVPGWLGSLPGT